MRALNTVSTNDTCEVNPGGRRTRCSECSTIQSWNFICLTWRITGVTGFLGPLAPRHTCSAGPHFFQGSSSACIFYRAATPSTTHRSSLSSALSVISFIVSASFHIQCNNRKTSAHLSALVIVLRDTLRLSLPEGFRIQDSEPQPLSLRLVFFRYTVFRNINTPTT